MKVTTAIGTLDSIEFTITITGTLAEFRSMARGEFIPGQVSSSDAFQKAIAELEAKMTKTVDTIEVETAAVKV